MGELRGWIIINLVALGAAAVFAGGSNSTVLDSMPARKAITTPQTLVSDSSEIKTNETTERVNIGNNTFNSTTQEEKISTFPNPLNISNVPYVFPSNSSEIKEVNETLRPIFLHKLTSDSPPIPIYQSPSQKIIISPPIPSVLTTRNPKHNPKEDSEWIQLDGENSEDELHPILVGKNVRGPQRDHGPGVPLVRGQLAAILAGIFVVLAVGGYIALLSWRRYLENRYGNREMLVNEEEMNEGTDMRYFSVSKV